MSLATDSSSSAGGCGGEKKLKKDSVGTLILTTRVCLVSEGGVRLLVRASGAEYQDHLLLLRCFLLSRRRVKSLSAFQSILEPSA